MKQRYKALRGMKDILPEESPRWQFLERTTREVFSRYGFQEIRTPLLEATELFARSVGEASDIVNKEMYRIEKGDDSICLRPENTASVVRAFVEHSLHRRIGSGYPERYYYIGPMFRHERPQKGRQRQFHQIGAELLGASEPAADAETIEMVDAFLDALAIEDRKLVLNSVGDAQCRPQFRETLVGWLAARLDRLCPDCNRRFRDNPMRVFDCKVEADRRLLQDAPSLLDMLCAPCEEHFDEVRRRLDAYGVGYEIDARIVRGLDYYERTVFEFVSTGLGSQNAILGGGRYDGLVEELGGPEVPGFGFAMGMERMLMLMPETSGMRSRIDLALIGLGRDGWEASIRIARRFRGRGLSCILPLAERPMGAQLKRADRLGARFAMFIGKDEIERGRFGLKNLVSGEQIEIEEAAVPAAVSGDRGDIDDT